MKSHVQILITGAVLLMPLVAAAEAVVRPLALDAADAYREQARYPHSSHAIRDAIDPILTKRQLAKQVQPGPNGDGPLLSVWSPELAYEPGQAALLYAELVDHAPKPPSLANLLDRETRRKAVRVSARLVGEDSGPLGEVDYRDDGRGADRIAGDGIYSARFVMPAARAPQPGHAESVAVRVQAITAGGDPRSALGGLLYSNPGARLTGRYRDAVRDGNLVISAEVEVLAPGRYHLAGTLAETVAGLGQRPVAWAQNARELDAGRQWIDLGYYGLIFRDLDVRGPMQLSSVTLTAALGMPNALSAVLRDVHRLPAHALSEFTARPFGDAGLLQAAERLERAAAASPE